MNELDLKLIYDYFFNKLQSVNSHFHRYLYDKINWDFRLIGIIGARGVGKTTMLIQHIKEHFTDRSKVIYASLDNIWFNAHTLYELAQYASDHGVTHLFLDEVHRYKGWKEEIKMINDSFGSLHVVYTGSSMMEINKSKADLSRRQTLYHLYGMSFREYLDFEDVISLDPQTLDDILTRHQDIAMEITERVKIMPVFEEYFKKGYYPFYKDEPSDYLVRLNEVVQTVLDLDLPANLDVSYATVQKAKRLFVYIAQSSPFVPDLNTLFKSIEVSRDTGLLLLNVLAQSDLLMLLSTKKPNYKDLVIPEKIFLHNPNLMHALSESPNIGAAREAYFMNQLQVGHTAVMPKQGDFKVDGKYLFEVGGRNKSFNQIADVVDSYLAIDGTAAGYGNRIPLWLFGLLY